MTGYPTNLNNSQWQVIKAFLNDYRKRRYSLREIINAIFYLIKTGCQWRMLPSSFPNWQIVYYYFSKWKSDGTFERIRCSLVKRYRRRSGKKSQPTAGIMDAQSVKSTLVSSSVDTGYDSGKRIKGMKRHIIVDTTGMLLCVKVHSAAIADRHGGRLLSACLSRNWKNVKKLFVDGGYQLPGKNQLSNTPINGYELEIVKRSDLKEGKVSPRRWVVERTFAWFETNRRNAKLYERQPKTAETIIELSAIRQMLNYLYT
jgi:putative transposase